MPPNTPEESARCKNCNTEFAFQKGKGRPPVYCRREGCDNKARRRKQVQHEDSAMTDDTISLHRPESSKATKKRRAHCTGQGSMTHPRSPSQNQRMPADCPVSPTEGRQNSSEQGDRHDALALQLQDDEGEEHRLAEARRQEGQAGRGYEQPFATPASPSVSEARSDDAANVSATVTGLSGATNGATHGRAQTASSHMTAFNSVAVATDRIPTNDAAHTTRCGFEVPLIRAESVDEFTRQETQQQALIEEIREQQEQQQTLIGELQRANESLSNLHVADREKIRQMETYTAIRDKQLKDALASVAENDQKLEEAAAAVHEQAEYMQARMSRIVSDKTQLVVEKETFRGQKIKLEEELRSCKEESRREMVKLQDEAAGLKDEALKLRRGARAVITERDTAVTERNTAVTERDTAVTERDNAVTERDTFKTEKDTLKTESDRLKAERDTIKSERETLKVKLQEVGTRRSQAEYDLASSMEKERKSVEENQSLKAQVDLKDRLLNTRNAVLDAEEHKTKSLAEKLAMVKQRNSEESQEKQALREQFDRLELREQDALKKLSESNRAIELLENRNLELSQESGCLRSSMESTESSYEKEIQNLLTEKKEMEQSYGRQRDALNQQISSLQEALQKGKADHAHEVKSLVMAAFAQENRAHTALATRHYEFMYAHRSLNAEHEAELHYTLANVRSSSQLALATARSHVKALEQQLKSAQQVTTSKDDAYEQLRTSIQKLNTKYDDANAKNGRLQVEVSNTRIENKGLRTEVMTLEDSLKAHKKQLITLKNDLTTAQETVEMYNGEYCRWKSRCMERERKRDNAQQKENVLIRPQVTMEIAERILGSDYGVTLESLHQLVQDDQVEALIDGCVLPRNIQASTATRKRYAPTKPITKETCGFLSDAYDCIQDPLFELSINGRVLPRGFDRLPQSELNPIAKVSCETATTGVLMQPTHMGADLLSKPWKLTRVDMSDQAVKEVLILLNKVKEEYKALAESDHQQPAQAPTKVAANHQVGQTSGPDVSDNASTASKQYSTSQSGLQRPDTSIPRKPATASLPTPTPSIGRGSPHDPGMISPQSEKNGKITSVLGSKRRRSSEVESRPDAPKQPRPRYEEERDRYWNRQSVASGRKRR